MGRHPAPRDLSKLEKPRPSDAELEAKILAKVGQRVHFLYPGTEGARAGVLRDRVVIPSSPGAHGIPYWDVVDLIEFPEAPEPHWTRVGYYRYAYGRLVWGSQTTLTDPLSVWRRLFAAARTRPWFAGVLSGDGPVHSPTLQWKS